MTPENRKSSSPGCLRGINATFKVLKMASVERGSRLNQYSDRILLEDDAVADGSQQVVEVELVFVVAWISAMTFSKFNQSLPKPER